MSVPVNPYAAPPSVCITASFEVAVDVMDETSPSNSATTTSSHPSDSHGPGQMAAKPDDPTEVALQDVHQETINFVDEGPPSLNRPTTEEFFQHQMSSTHLLGQPVHSASTKSGQSF